MISKVVDSPVGRLQLLATESALCGLNWSHQHATPPNGNGARQPDERSRILDRASEELQLYFEGKLQEFSVPCAPEGTFFQQQVWAVLGTIEWGKTLSYKTVANALNKPSAARAVGTAIGKNPLPIFIPCHRVVGSNGSLTGFSGGIDIKRELLALENKQLAFSTI